MSMTRGDLRELCLQWLDDLNAGYFTPVQVNGWLNNALIEVQKQLIQAGDYWYLKCATTNTIANTDCYALPPDFLKCNKLQIRQLNQNVPNQVWGDLISASLGESSNFDYGSGMPTVFTIGKDCFYLKIIPDQAYTLRLFYSYRVTPMVDDLNVPDVPEQYQQYIAVIATMDGFLKDERSPANLVLKQQMYVEMMKKDAMQRNRAQPRRVVRTMQDDGAGLFY